jgi:hypothetical protein
MKRSILNETTWLKRVTKLKFKPWMMALLCWKWKERLKWLMNNKKYYTGNNVRDMQRWNVDKIAP